MKKKDTIDIVKRMHKLYLKKYEEACIFREHDKAIMYQGHLNALEHLLIDAGEGSLVNQRRLRVEERRNKIVKLWSVETSEDE
jgi:hypothetical protein